MDELQRNRRGELKPSPNSVYDTLLLRWLHRHRQAGTKVQQVLVPSNGQRVGKAGYCEPGCLVGLCGATPIRLLPVELAVCRRQIYRSTFVPLHLVVSAKWKKCTASCVEPMDIPVDEEAGTMAPTLSEMEVAQRTPPALIFVPKSPLAATNEGHPRNLSASTPSLSRDHQPRAVAAVLHTSNDAVVRRRPLETIFRIRDEIQPTCPCTCHREANLILPAPFRSTLPTLQRRAATQRRRRKDGDGFQLRLLPVLQTSRLPPPSYRFDRVGYSCFRLRRSESLPTSKWPEPIMYGD
jgi:hypothetical protein